MFARQDRLLYINIKYQGEEERAALVLPKQLQTEILKAAHTSRFAGHGGNFRTCKRISQSYWWPRMADDVRSFISNCLTCAKAKNPPRFRQQHAPHQPLQIPDAPGQAVHADIFGPIAGSEEGKHYILVMTDRWSKFTDLFALRSKSAEEVGNCIFNEYITRYGVMQTLTTDNGREFANDVGKILYERMGIAHGKTAALHPQTNASAEVYNKQIARYLTCIIEDNAASTLDWPLYLPALRLSYNSAVHKSLLMSPFSLTFFRDPNLPFFDLTRPQRFYSEDWGTSNFIRLKKCYKLVKENLERAEEDRLQQSNKTAVEKHFDIGEKVLVYFPASTVKEGVKKFTPRWRDGYFVDRKVAQNTFLLRSTEKGRRATVVHADRLKKRPEGLAKVEEEDTVSPENVQTRPKKPAAAGATDKSDGKQAPREKRRKAQSQQVAHGLDGGGPRQLPLPRENDGSSSSNDDGSYNSGRSDDGDDRHLSKKPTPEKRKKRAGRTYAEVTAAPPTTAAATTAAARAPPPPPVQQRLFARDDDQETPRKRGRPTKAQAEAKAAAAAAAATKQQQQQQQRPDSQDQ